MKAAEELLYGSGESMKKWPWKKAEVKNRKNNNMKSNFSTTANIFVRNFF